MQVVNSLNIQILSCFIHTFGLTSLFVLVCVIFIFGLTSISEGALKQPCLLDVRAK